MSKPKILLYDIETTPDLSYVWGRYQQDVIAVKQDWSILSFAYKWLGDRKVICHTREKGDERGLLVKLWTILDEAEVVIAHNGDEFDQKKSNARFLASGMKPPSPYRSVDTKKVAKKHFKFNSNSLDELGRILGVGRKIKHSGFDLWLGCMGGNSASWKKMAKYNKQDVALLERVYRKLLPWIDGHPHVAMLSGSPKGCPKCGGTKFKHEGIRRTAMQSYRRFRCMKCLGYCRSRVAEKGEKPEKV